MSKDNYEIEAGVNTNIQIIKIINHETQKEVLKASKIFTGQCYKAGA